MLLPMGLPGPCDTRGFRLKVCRLRTNEELSEGLSRARSFEILGAVLVWDPNRSTQNHHLHMGVCRKGGLSRSAPQALCYIPLQTQACYIPLVAQPSCLPQDRNLRVCRENLPLLHTLCNGVCNGRGPRALLQANRFGTCPYKPLKLSTMRWGSYLGLYNASKYSVYVVLYCRIFTMF